MKKNQTKRLLALVLTLALTLSNVPTTVFAEDVTATEQQSTTEQQVEPQEETTEQVDQQQQQDEDTNTQQTEHEAEFHGNKVAGVDLRGKFQNAFGVALEYRFRVSGTQDEWQTVDITKSHTLQSNVYDVQTRQPFGKWKNAGTMQVKIYYNLGFVVEGHEAGGVLIDGQSASSAKVYQNEAVTFSVKDIDGYDVTVEGVTQNENGTYTVASVQADTTVKVVYTLRQYSTVESTAVENAKIKINGSSDASVKVENNKEFTIEVTPNAGYAVTEIKVNDTALDNVTFANQTASASYQAGENQTYSVSATLVKTGFALNDKNEDGVYAVGYRDGMDQATTESNIFNTLVNAGASVPADLTVDDVTIQYYAGAWGKWQEVNYEPDFLHGFTDHKFGTKETEQIKITYAGNDQYGSFSSDEITVTIVDPRSVSVLELNAGVTLQYNTEETMKQEIYEKVIASLNTGEGTAIAHTIDDFTIEFERALGEQTVTVSYKGSDDYKPCEASTVITIEKGKASVTVNSQNITYGESFAPVFSSNPSDAKVIGIIGGVTGNGALYVSVDASQITINDIAGKEIPVIGNLSLQKFITDTLGIKEFKVSQLTDILQKIPGADISDIVAGIQQAIDVIEQVAPGLLDTTVSLGGLPSEAGVYTAVGVTASPNYKTALGIGLLTVAPKTSDVKLAFDQEFDNNAHKLTISQAQAFDFGGHIVDGDVQETNNVHTLYVGMTTSGKLYTGTTPCLEPGAYTESVYVLGGNYFALPISRLYTIQREEVEIKFEPSALTARYDGNPHGLKAGVYNANGDRIADAEVKYAGIEAGIEGYYSKEMPVDAGFYLASASFAGDDTYQPAIKLGGGSVLILKSYAKGKIQVGSLTTTYGEPTDLTKVQYTTSGLATRDVETIKATVKCDGNDSAVGSHAISVSVPKSVQKNYYRTIKTQDGTHTIEQRAITVQIGSYSKTYGTEDPAFSYEITEGSLAEGDTLKDLGIKLARKQGENVGNYEIYVENEAELNANYAITVVNGNLEITQANAVIRVTGGNDSSGNYTKSYGDIDPIYTYCVDALVNTDVPENEEFGKVKLVREEGEDVNTYTITPTVENLSPNYTYTVETGTLEIIPRSITISAEDVQKVYDGEAAEAPYTISGLPADKDTADAEDLGLHVKADMPTEAGTYEVSYALDETASQNANYKVTFEYGQLTIAKKVITISVTGGEQNDGNYVKRYDDADPAYSFSVTDKNDAAVTDENLGEIKVVREKGEDVGTYMLIPTVENESENYEYGIVANKGRLEILPREITISAEDVEKTYDGKAAEAPYTISGLAADKDTADAADLGLELKVVTSQTASADGTKLETPIETEGMPVDAGTYTVTYALDESASQNQNYDVTFLPFNVSIKKVNTDNTPTTPSTPNDSDNQGSKPNLKPDSKSDSVVDTGDTANVMTTMTATALGALVAIALLLFKRRKTDK